MGHFMKWGQTIAMLFLIIALAACGSSGSSSGSSTSSDSGSGAGGSSATAFTVSGTVSDLSVSNSLSKSTSGTVTNVMAVAPGVGGTTCKQGTVNSNGTFSIDLTGLKPWLLYFFDSSRRGNSMFLGRFASSTWDALTPGSETGSADIGTVSINADTGIASSSKSHSDLISGFGVDTTTASFMGTLDDSVRRYSNPDTDNDGSVDCDTSNSTAKFPLDFHVRFNMTLSGTTATIADIIDSYLSDTVTATYTGTGIYVAYPTSYSTATTGSVTFQDSAVTTEEGGAIAANTATSAVTTNSFSGYYGFGPNTTSTSELPTGTVVFTFGSKTLTFSDVKTPTLAELTAPTGRIFPFIKFVKSDSSCTSNCTLASLDYKWMKKTESSWTEASLTEVKLAVASAGGTVSIRVDNDSSKTFQITIPKTAISGSITWTSSSATLSGVTAAEFNALTTSQLCHLGLSYDDQLGMRYFETINDAAGTCS